LPDVAFQHTMHAANVDVMMLVDKLDVIYEDVEAQAVGLSFARLVEVILSMRGCNTATAKDIKEQYKVIKKLLGLEFDLLTTKLQGEFNNVKDEICLLEEMVEMDGDELDEICLLGEMEDARPGSHHARRGWSRIQSSGMQSMRSMRSQASTALLATEKRTSIMEGGVLAGITEDSVSTEVRAGALNMEEDSD